MIINIIYDFLIIRLSELLSRMNNFPNIIQGIGLALLTILIPLAIAILTDVYQKRRDGKIEFANLDLHVILDNVFKIKLLILSVFLIFLPMLFWEILSGPVKLFGIVLTSIGIIITIRIITNVYCWVKGNSLEYRFSYLKKVKNYNDLETVWRSTWEAENINFQNEKEFFMIFSSKIDQLLELNKKSLKTISKLLNDFNSFINNRPVFFLVATEEVFPKILEWHFKVWQKKYMCLGKKIDLDKFTNYSGISRVLNSIFRNIEEHSLKEGEAFSLFAYFKKHAEHYKHELVKRDHEHHYIIFLFRTFYQVFFENVLYSSEILDIWEQYFPKEWKISKTNLLDKEHKFLSSLSWKYFLYWANDRIIQSKEEKDLVLGEFSRDLFPEVDPNLWAKFLVFVFSGSDEKNRVKLAIERPWNFGPIERVKLYSINEISSEEMHKKMSEDIEREEQRTYGLACLLFKEEFSKENIAQYIKEIKNLEYPKESNEENEKIKLLDIFNGMLEHLNK
ncbi:MAG: hypothetical protein KAV97_00080 [Actinomycetia bacterium]|nr:hypothetical protein [Actinomycetes bacterium]